MHELIRRSTIIVYSLCCATLSFGQLLCLEAWHINANSCALTRDYGSYLPQETLNCTTCKDVAHVKKQSVQNSPLMFYVLHDTENYMYVHITFCEKNDE